MAVFVVRRLLAMALVLSAVSVLVFAIFNVIPGGDPAQRMAGRQASPQAVEEIRREWGFDRSLTVQYATTMRKLLTGDLESYATRQNVVGEIRRGLPRTLSLAVGAALLWLAGGVALGLVAASREGGWPDRVVGGLSVVGISMPVFWLGALASYYLGFRAGWFPAGGYEQVAESGLLAWLHHLVLPWLVLATAFIGIYSRVVRSSLLDTVDDDYVRTARAKGLAESQVMTRHVLRNSLIPVVTLRGLDFGLAIGGGGQARAPGSRRRRDRPRAGCDRGMSAAADVIAPALLEVTHLKTHFPVRRGPLGRVGGRIHAVDDVSFSVLAGDTLGLVGESGCGKSTLARTIMRLLEPTSVAVSFQGRDLLQARGRELKEIRRNLQMGFQDPFGSLNPRRRIGQIVGGPLRDQGTPRRDLGRRVAELLELVGLAAAHANRFPSSPAASVSASASRGRWPSSPACWCSTSRSAPSTCPSRRRPSIRSPTCGRS